MMKQFWFQAHWLMGITAGIVLAFVGATGGMLSFETDILNWLNSDVRSVSPRPEGVLSPAELVERIKAANPKKEIIALSVSSDPTTAAKVTFAFPKGREGAGGQRGNRGRTQSAEGSAGGRDQAGVTPREGAAGGEQSANAAEQRNDGSGTTHRERSAGSDQRTSTAAGRNDPAGREQSAATSRERGATGEARAAGGMGGRQRPPGRGPRGEVRYVNPYSGALIDGDGGKGESFFQGTRSLHRWLTAGDFGNREVGKQIVDASTVICVVLALSGLYLRWPRSARNWRSWLKLDFALKGRSFLWHLHAVLGTWVLVLFVVMSLTGLYFGYEWYRNGLYTLTGTPRPAERGGERREGGRAARTNESQPTREAAPDLTIAWAAFQRASTVDGFSTANLDLSHGKRVEIRYLAAKAPHERAFNNIVIDSTSGDVIKSERYATKPAGAKLIASMFPLHSGSFFGVPGTVIFMIASLAMPVFAITGWMLYLDRRKKKYTARATARDLAAMKPKTASDGASDLLIGFASQAGFARQLAWQTAGSLQSAGVNVQVHSLAKLGAEQLSKFKRALFVVSTFGEGEPPDEARGFARRFMHDSMPLPNMKFGLLALGDRQYQTYCAFGEALEGWLRKQGAEPLFPRVDVDCGQPEALVEWQARLGELTGARLSAWIEPEFQRWRLADRRLINEGSVGAPMYHIELEPADPAALRWEAGDIAEILAPAVPSNDRSINAGAPGNADRDSGGTGDGPPVNGDAAANANHGTVRASDGRLINSGAIGCEDRGPGGGSNGDGTPISGGTVRASDDCPIPDRGAHKGEPASTSEDATDEPPSEQRYAGARSARAALPDARREFSISSIPKDGRIHLVVRQVRHPDGTLGIGSGWLTERAPIGAFVKLRVRSNPSFHAPSTDAPLILIGNGTGIAGLRSHIKAREQAHGKGVWLIFGERHEQNDYLYRREIEAWRATGTLERLDLAFSRDQTERLYVQHVLTARGEIVREWIQKNAVILVCGSLEGMAPGVEAALRQVLGEPELLRLANEGRYRRDVY